MKEFKCKDAGFSCDYRARGESTQEVMQKAKEHGKAQHHLQDKDLQDEKLRPLVHDVA